MARLESPDEWVREDLSRVGQKLAEFAFDIGQDPNLKRDLLEEVSAALRRFENRSGTCVT